MRPAIALLAITLMLTAIAGRTECECLWQGSFSEVHAATDLVVSGTVSSAKGNSIDLTVEQTLRGEMPLAPIRIWLKAADYCRPDAALFPMHSQWVMALHKITDDVPGGFNPLTPNISFGRVGDYSLSSCGGYWLYQSDGRVTGNLINAPRWVREPKMTPVLVELVAAYVNGQVSTDALLEASREDPALRKLMLDTRSFLRNGD